ncbi:MAG: RIP metalloprotease RseP [Nitrospirota bacterium]
MLTTIVSFIIVLGILVFIHELGHFLMARRAGVGVETFSLGFGPKIFCRKVGETEYCISAIPLGGYVKMVGQDDMKVQAPDDIPEEERARSFLHKSVGKRSLIILAGPVMNVVLAVILMPLAYMIGVQIPAFLEKPAVIGWVEPDTGASKAGLKLGDRILAIDGLETRTWETLREVVATNPGKTAVIDIERSGQRLSLSLPIETVEKVGLGDAGLIPEVPPVVGSIMRGFPAEEAGIKPGDRIVSVGGTPVGHWHQIPKLIKAHGMAPLDVTLSRDGQEVRLTLTPKPRPEAEVPAWKKPFARFFGPPKPAVNNGPMIGIGQKEETVLKKYGLADAVGKGTERILYLTGLTFSTIGKLLSFDLSLKALGGPIMIAQVTGSAARSGAADLIQFMSAISLQLGILNLLPIPVLDGGWLLFLLIESLKGKPISRRAMEISQTVGFALLIMLIVVVSYHDVLRLLLP